MTLDGIKKGAEREATAYDRTIQELAWQPDGRGLILSVRQGGEQAGLFRMSLSGALRPLAIDNGILRWPSLSRSGGVHLRQFGAKHFARTRPGEPGRNAGALV